MGYIFCSETRERLIAALTQSRDDESVRREVLEHSLHGDVLWTLVKITTKQEGLAGLRAGESFCFIRCDLLAGRAGQWGYEPLEEVMQPTHYSCPLHFFDQAPVRSAAWRERVRAFHAQRTPAAPTASG